jgi:hypothetical protein
VNCCMMEQGGKWTGMGHHKNHSSRMKPGFSPVLYFVHHLAFATELDVDTMDKPNQIKSCHLTCYVLCRSVFCLE